MGKLTRFARKDIISDLPQSIIDLILTKLPIRDAVRTSILSSKWRYQWASMTQLVFDGRCVRHAADEKVAEKELANFVTRFLMLHDGPIHKFKLSTSCLKKSSDIDQWLLLLSRKDIKELVLDVHGYEWRWKDPRVSIPRSIFSFKKLTRLTLFAFVVKPPLEFRGFPCLKYLELDGVTITLQVIENLISGCPHLEKFKFTIKHKLALTVRSPNLKHLRVDGYFEDLYLEHTPLLVSISICFYPLAWKGNILMKFPVTHDYLKFIEIGKMNHRDLNKVLYVLDLLLQSPNLQELHISSPDLELEELDIYDFADAPEYAHYKTADFDIWGRKCPADFTFKCLKKVKMSYISSKNDMEFVKFVLGRSPVLEVMSISPCNEYGGAMNLVNEVLRFRRASPEVEIKFFDQSSHAYL